MNGIGLHIVLPLKNSIENQTLSLRIDIGLDRYLWHYELLIFQAGDTKFNNKKEIDILQ